jgi:1-acyl-sn-glycerol-3-phosphate acyltransferase
LTDALDAFGLAGPLAPPARRLLGYALARRVSRVASEIQALEARVDAVGLQHGARHALDSLVRGVAVQGLANVPRNGPLLVVANHPGLADAVALFAYLPRADLRVIAAHRRLLAALPATAAHLIVVPEDGSPRLSLLRDAVAHLRRGGAVLTFPAGCIEPDPAHRKGAVAALAGWSECVNMFARRVPALTIVPAAVSGVLSPAALRHPLTRLRRGPRDRDWLAATLQMLAPRLRDVTPQLVFGRPVHAGTMAAGKTPHAAVCEAMQRLLTRMP